ncbi:MAG: transglutaminase [Acidobacteria bacterium]|nr:transglutaminase [Acidobacteriota bacterium]
MASREESVESVERVGVLGLVLRLVWLALVVGVPFLGVWTASSLAAYRNGPVWLVCLAGLLLFPVLPLIWDARATTKRRSNPNGPRPSLGFFERVVLRTLFLNVAFLAVLVAAAPAGAFAALQTRGDWFLEDREGPVVERLRSTLFDIAGGLEGLYKKTRKNRYVESIDPASRDVSGPEPAPRRAESTIPRSATVPAIPTVPTGSTASGPQSTPTPHTVPARTELPFASAHWPLAPALHPLVSSLPVSAETSIESVARYLASNERDPWMRIKALHDYVADRVAYDVPAYRSGSFPPQDPESVFRSRLAVCAGYAQLLAALAKAAGEEVVVVTGDARLESSGVTGEGHAWNAARIEGQWVLLDATWNAGSISERGFDKKYGTAYLFVPPEVIGVTHFPEDEAWQLRDAPLSRGEFFRQPVLRAGFFSAGLALLSPTRSQIDAEREVVLRVANPLGRSLLVNVVPEAGGGKTQCSVSPGRESVVTCALPSRGRFVVKIFASGDSRAWHPLVGELSVHGG